MKVLLAGNTAYLTAEWIRQSFSGWRAVVVGKNTLHSDPENGLTVVRQADDYAALMEAHSFDAVVLFSNSLTYRSQETGEMEWLYAVLDACRKNAPVKVLYLAGPDIHGAPDQALTDAAVQMSLQLAQNDVELQVIRCLHLYNGAAPGDWFYRLFAQLERSGGYDFSEPAAQPLCFMAMDDLSELIRRMMEDWPARNGVSVVPECFGHTFAQLTSALQGIKSRWTFTCNDAAPALCPAGDDLKLRRRYGWFPRYSVLGDLKQVYEDYQAAKPRRKGLFDMLRKQFARHKKLFLLVELLLCIAIALLCGHLSNWQVQFSLIDFRLLMIVLMGTMHGMNMGLLSAAAASAMLLYAYNQQGINYLTLFYESTNWIVFIAYFTVGAVCGYVRLYHTDKIRFTSSENERLKEKLSFVQNMYHEVLSDKREYKKQIVSSKDSFGKIFQITQQLNVLSEKEVFMQTVDVLESIMENHSVALYIVSRGQHFGRLIAASKQLMPALPASIRLSDYDEAMQTVLSGQVYVNSALREGYPAYMSGLVRGDELRMLVMLHSASFEQMTLYYTNLFHILCGLSSSALNHALDYQLSRLEKSCIAGTRILNAEQFEKELALNHLMGDRKIATHMLLKIETGGKSLEEMDHLLSGKFRENDVLGVDRSGQLYVILAQATSESLPAIMRRLQAAGIETSPAHIASAS